MTVELRANRLVGALHCRAENCFLRLSGEWTQFESANHFAQWQQVIKALPWWQLTVDITKLQPENGGLPTDFAAEMLKLLAICRHRHGTYDILAASRRQLGIMGFPKVLSEFGPYVFFEEDGWFPIKHTA